MRIAPRQIDRLVRRETGNGSATTEPFRLPRGRYTVFVNYDPPEAVRSFGLVHLANGAIPNLNATGADRVGDTSAPIVQQELLAGRYRIDVGTDSPSCSWDVQVVLNSMLTWGRAPQAWRPSVAPPKPITVRSGENPVFLLARTGRYNADWTVGPGRSQHVTHPHSLVLRAADGHAVHLGAANGDRGYRRNPHFLGAGEWTVEMTTDVEWELLIAPVVGALGGGTHDF
jgi:hypothetical protein